MKFIEHYPAALIYTENYYERIIDGSTYIHWELVIEHITGWRRRKMEEDTNLQIALHIHVGPAQGRIYFRKMEQC